MSRRFSLPIPTENSRENGHWYIYSYVWNGACVQPKLKVAPAMPVAAINLPGFFSGFIFQYTTQGALQNMPKKIHPYDQQRIAYVEIWAFSKIFNIIRAYMQKKSTSNWAYIFSAFQKMSFWELITCLSCISLAFVQIKKHVLYLQVKS